MAIRRNPRPVRYSIIPNGALEDTRLSWAARGMLCYLLSKPDNWAVNRDHLESQSPDGQTKVRSTLTELETLGYLKRQRTNERVPGKKGVFRWEAVVFDAPQEAIIGGGIIGGKPTHDMTCEDTVKEQVGIIGGLSTGGKSTGIVTTEVTNTELVNTDKTAQALFEQEPKIEKPDASPYSPEFEQAWSLYPRKVEKLKAYKAWKATLKRKAETTDMILAAKHYRADCDSEQREQKYMKHGATFYGPDEPWRDYVKPTGDYRSQRANVDTDRSGGGVVSKDQLRELMKNGR